MATEQTFELIANAGWDQRILVCRYGSLVDTFIVVMMRYVVMIDTQFNSATALALVEVARPWLEGRQLLVVNTHADWDHAWGNHVFAQPGGLLPAPIIASRACAERLRSQEMVASLEEMRREQPGRFDDVVLTPPTLLFEEQLWIDGGDLTLELFATPGHSHDHISIYIPEIRTLLAGDAAELPFPFVQSAASMPSMRASFKGMLDLNPEHVLYCHAPLNSGPAVIKRNIGYFDTMEQRCRAALASGVPAQPAADADVEALVGFPYAEAVPDNMDADALAGFYQPGHQYALRAMLEAIGDRR